MEHGMWMGRGITRDEVVEILTPLYKHLKDKRTPDRDVPHPVTPHKLAVLYLVFALGALVDLTLPAYSAEAETYFNLGRAALSLRSIFESSDLTTVQAIFLTALFHSYGGPRYSHEGTWSLISLAAKVSQSVCIYTRVSNRA